eukprot:CCRYP_015234-RA/>CCRYP_015234-RA protein AED:0.02 eAED:0.02 QI:411/1/1/1/0.5/0.33/3/139/739
MSKEAAWSPTNANPKPPTAEKDDSDHQIRKRREFTQRLNLKRRVYRELTSYQVFPLQEMALKDLDEKLNDYLSAGIDKRESDRDCEDSATDGGAITVIRSKSLLGDSSSDECNANLTSKGTNEPAADQSTELRCLRDMFLQQFMREKTIPHNYATRTKIIVPSEEVTSIRNIALDNLCCESSQKNFLPVDNNEHKPQQSEIYEAENVSRRSVFSKKLTDDKDKSHVQQQCLSCNDEVVPQEEQRDGAAVSNFLPILWSIEPRIFAFETSSNGKRRYISAHLGRFMDHYWRECDVYNRHYYELIREGSPCRLYLDLEFSKLSNQELTSEVAESLLTELFGEMKQQFETLYQISIERHQIVDLDSSTSKKFSRHWILHLPNGELFSDARAAGVFMKLLVSRLEKEQQSGELQSKGHELLSKHLFVKAENCTGDDVKLVRFIDLGVYTRNRLFRLMGSTKFGKRPDAALRIANANTFPFPDEFCNAKFYLPEFMTSGDESGCKNSKSGSDSNEFDYEQFCKSFDWEDHAAALESTLVVPAHTMKICYPILPDLDSDEDSRLQKNLLKTGLRSMAGQSALKLQRSSCSHGKSPFPSLERFIVNILGRRQGLEGTICTFSLGNHQPIPRTISYNMKGNRWCENIGRAHKSNNIIWNVHLIDRVCWQSCHDPDCRGFRGEQIVLPDEVNSEIDDFFLDMELALLDIHESQGICDTTDQGDRLCSEEEFDDPLLEEAMCNLNISSL